MTNEMLNNEYTVVEGKENNVVVLHETLERFINNFLMEKKKRSIETHNAYRSDINKLSRDMFGYKNYSFIKKEDIENVNIDDLVDYFDMCVEETSGGERKFSNKTINRRMSSLKSLFEYLTVRDKIKYDIFKLKSILTTLPDDGIEIDALEEDDAFRCIEYFKTLSKGDELYAIGRLALVTSLRVNELLTLTWKQFTVKDDEVIVKSRGNIRGKGNKSWIKSISLDMYNELLTNKKDSTKVFTIHHMNISRAMKKAIIDLKLDNGKYSFHSFRKTSLTHKYFASGKDISFTMEEANHSDPRTTMKYVKSRNLTRIDMVSSRENKDEELYKNASREELLQAIDLLDGISKLYLNKILDDMRKESENVNKTNKKVI